MYIRDDFVVYEGMTFTAMHIDIGTMTVEGQTGWEASGTEPANWEYTLKNNTSLNLKEDAPYNSYLQSQCQGGNSRDFCRGNRYPEQHVIYLDPYGPDNGLNLGSWTAMTSGFACTFTSVGGSSGTLD